MNADVLTLENVKILGDHQHSYSGGKCTGCGAPCPHDRVEIATGVCADRGTQLEAMVTYSGKAPVFFTSFLSAIDPVPHNMKEQVRITLLKPGYDLGTKDLYLENNNDIRLDLNDHNLFGSGTIFVRNRSALTIANGDLDKDLAVEAAGGSLTVEKDCGSVDTIRVTDAGSVVTVLWAAFALIGGAAPGESVSPIAKNQGRAARKGGPAVFVLAPTTAGMTGGNAARHPCCGCSASPTQPGVIRMKVRAARRTPFWRTVRTRTRHPAGRSAGRNDNTAGRRIPR